MANRVTREDYVVWRYDRARSLGLDMLKLLLQTTIVIAGVPIIFYDKVRAIFVGITFTFVLMAWSCMLTSLIVGFIALLLIFEGDYHGAHMESDRLAGDQETASVNERVSNRFLHTAHWLGIAAGTLFALGIVLVIVAVWLAQARLS
jgi:hypothetical protein